MEKNILTPMMHGLFDRSGMFMGKYDERISDRSIWLTSTPTQASLSLPFYIMEAGHFYTEPDYKVNREQHDSYLFLYTQNGCGTVHSDGNIILLPAGSAIIIDCHKCHRYAPSKNTWEFIWMHIKGSAVEAFFRILYPGGVFAVNISEPERLTAEADELIHKIRDNDILNAVRISSALHGIFNILIEDSLKNEQEKSRIRYSEYVEQTVKLIHKRYSEPLTIEDMMDGIPLSKYHFIRVFKRIMGTTPYNYLTNFRINSAKIFLRTTDMPISEIADKCGFSDTSSFISQFKRHINQKPLQYRRDFS